MEITRQTDQGDRRRSRNLSTGDHAPGLPNVNSHVALCSAL